mgnify:CR=1 FL=1
MRHFGIIKRSNCSISNRQQLLSGGGDGRVNFDHRRFSMFSKGDLVEVKGLQGRVGRVISLPGFVETEEGMQRGSVGKNAKRYGFLVDTRPRKEVGCNFTRGNAQLLTGY